MVALDSTFLIVTVSLLVQLAVLGLLLYGYLMLKRFKFREHGIVMSIAVFVQLVAVFTIMVPSFTLAVLPEYIFVNTTQTVSIVSLFHEFTGGISLALGVWFVGSWHFRKDFKGCFNKRKTMAITMIIWLAALSFGITLYTLFNWQIMMS